MKPSHYTTPRQLSDCAFIPGADPIQVFGKMGWLAKMMRRVFK